MSDVYPEVQNNILKIQQKGKFQVYPQWKISSYYVLLPPCVFKHNFEAWELVEISHKCFGCYYHTNGRVHLKA